MTDFPCCDPPAGTPAGQAAAEPTHELVDLFGEGSKPASSHDDPTGHFLDTFSELDTAHDLGAHMTCRETDAFAGLMLSHGKADAAEAVTAGHRSSEGWQCEGEDDHMEVDLSVWRGDVDA